MAQQTVNAYNLFVDSGRALQSDSTGDNIKFALNHHPISCGDNQFIRLSVQNFQMYKSWYNVNNNNNKFRINSTQSFPAGSNVALSNVLDNNKGKLAEGNYATMYELASAFASGVGTTLATWTGLTVSSYSGINPLSGQDVAGTGTNNIQFTITFTTVHGITASLLNLQTQVEDGDACDLLGGVRLITLNDITSNSATITAPTTSSLLFVMPYNCQLTTINSIYLKTDLNTTNIGTITYLGRNTDDIASTDQIIQSRILAKIIPDVEFAGFTTQTNLEYFVNLTQKTLTHLSLRLTDSRDRPLPLILPSTLSNTKPSNVNGNRSFEAVIKIEIIQYLNREPPLQSTPVPHSLTPRFESRVNGLNDNNLANIDKQIELKIRRK